jgi:hypothetical protein
LRPYRKPPTRIQETSHGAYRKPPTWGKVIHNRLYRKPPTSYCEGIQETSHTMNRTLSVEASQQLELFEAQEIVRPDINIAKWAGLIFASPWARDLYEEKEIIFQLGADRSASIRIVPALNHKRPTTTTQRVFFTLLQIWEQAGKPANGSFSFSARQIAHLLSWKWAGRDTAERIQEHLSILNSTSIDWERSFVKGDLKETHNDAMSLIDAKGYLKREKMINNEFFYAQHTVRLNHDLVTNMIAGKTKPFNYKAFISIKNETAAKLYNLLDNFLARKRRWERRATALIYEDLELEGARYKTAFARKAKLQEIQRELDGKELSTGTLKVSIAKTVDGKDWKLIADKIPAVLKDRGRHPQKLANSKDEIPDIVEGLISALSELGTVKKDSEKVLGTLARWYSRQMLFETLSILKADYRGQIKQTPIRAFIYLAHVEAHKRGREWIKECGSKCRHRPENRLSLDEIIKQNARN